jgi:tRNA uridine 5-carboxymethylaminomethyl modification enzyme
LPILNDFIQKSSLDRELLCEQVEISLKYEGYIEKEIEMVNKFNKMESIFMKEDFDYHNLNSLSMEARIKLSSIKPSTLGQASRISGISPADISVLMVYLSR